MWQRRCVKHQIVRSIEICSLLSQLVPNGVLLNIAVNSRFVASHLFTWCVRIAVRHCFRSIFRRAVAGTSRGVHTRGAGARR